VRESLRKNDILFFNWQSVTKKARTSKKGGEIEEGDYANIFMRDNESDRNLPTFITNTIEEGRKIVLIIDESHLHLSKDTEHLIDSVICPTLRIDVSATPRKNPQVRIDLPIVIDTGMIKKDIVINE